MRRYRSLIADNSRWEGFQFRPGDIVVSTPPKCGTTWTQALCALLVLDTLELDRPLSAISPWLDMLTNSREEVVAALDAQDHRRVIKTHTPLDGLPADERATYVCVGRDPRDVSLSWDHHMANLDLQALMLARANVVGLDDLADLPVPAPRPDDPVERFWQWADAEPQAALIGATLAQVLQHFQTFWDHRDDDNVALFHYSDLKADVHAEIRRLADALGIAVTDERVRAIAEATTFERMKSRAEEFAPDVHNRIWQSTEDFFHRGESGQWCHLLDDDGVRRYEDRVAELVPPDLAEWAHRGRSHRTTSVTSPVSTS